MHDLPCSKAATAAAGSLPLAAAAAATAAPPPYTLTKVLKVHHGDAFAAMRKAQSSSQAVGVAAEEPLPPLLLFYGDEPQRLAQIAQQGFVGFGGGGGGGGGGEPLLFSSSISIADSEYRRRRAAKAAPSAAAVAAAAAASEGEGDGEGEGAGTGVAVVDEVVSWRMAMALVDVGRCCVADVPLARFVARR